MNSLTLEKIFGHSQSKIISKNLMEVIPPSFKPWFKNGANPNFFSGEKNVFRAHPQNEMPALRADGNSFSAEFTITRVRLPGHPMFTLSKYP